MSIGEQIRKYRNEMSLSQKELGEKLGVSQAMIAQYESGKRIPKKETIEKIATALGVDPFSLYSFDMATSELNSILSQNEKQNPKQHLVPDDLDIKFTTIREYKDFKAFIGQYKGSDYTKEELEEIKRFAEFLKSKREEPPEE